jgi:uncharacterized protein DUF6644
MFLELCTWLENTPVAVLMKESLWGFPILVTMHIMGVALSVGTLTWFDLRLIGIGFTGTPITQVYRRIMPWAFAGFFVMAVSGSLLFVAYATAAYWNNFFWIKMSAIALAGVNALTYHLLTERTIAGWDSSRRPPAAARLAGLTSIVLWTLVILMGRTLSYTMF